MTPELAKKWADALRSGRYKQGQRYLCDEDEDTYCCLGVLYEVVNGRKPDTRLSVLSDEVYDLELSYGLSYADEVAFVQMNDDDEQSFKEIADYIERRWCQ